MKTKLNYSKFAIEIIKYLWLTFNCLAAIPFVVAVVEKIRRPGFKNLSTQNLIVIGIVIAISLTLNLILIYKKSPLK
ncbi:hypothetical protein [Winogradskyella sp. 4-2091]|uniref:hypothetical protein n=1 Tax=Winogradskyella sp. 4-2091 TaxID=3381659 RepID=UPI0038921F30